MDIYDAYARSGDVLEIVHCEHRGTEPELLVALAEMYDHEIDSTRENDGTIDVWGFRTKSPAGEMDWRFRVTLTN
jgi:hypothetical protein